MKAKFVYETIGDVLKSKSTEDINKSLETSNLSPNDLLVKSAEAKYIEGVEMALDRGANIHYGTDLALRWAAINGYLEIVKLLLDRGANVHAREDYALRWAIERGHLDVVKILKKQMGLNESLRDLLTSKSQEEIDKNFIEKYGFIPSEDTLVHEDTQPNFEIEFHQDPNYVNVFWRKRPGKNKPMTRLRGNEVEWIKNIIIGEIDRFDGIYHA